MIHRSPCSEPVVDFMCVTHEKESIRPEYFPHSEALCQNCSGERSGHGSPFGRLAGR